MHTSFKTIGIIGKHSAPEITDSISSLSLFLKEKGYNVIIDANCASLLSDNSIESCATDTLGMYCDIAIAMGGDGTFLAATSAIVKYNIPLIGINLGRLGFLVDISPELMQEKLVQMLSGQFIEETRYLLQARIIRDDQTIHKETAVNEVVIHRWVTPSMIEIVTHINGIYLNSQRSDGLIISTPTGSTAYSLSAGGPILHPSLNALILVPLNPHTFSNRPIVIDDNSEIEISFCQTKQINALVSCDHLEIPEVLISDKIMISKYPDPIRILHPEGHEFFNILRQKLNWSSGYHI